MRLIELAAGPWAAAVAPERGGRMVRLAHAGRHVLEPIHDWNPPDRPWPAGGLYPLAPYSNRIAGARLRFEDREIALDPYPPGSPHAIHGPGHRRAWEVREQGPGAVRLHLRHEPDGDWPWAFEADLAYELADDAVTARIALRNLSDARMPAGIGLHPFFHAPDGARFSLSYRDRWPQAEADLARPDYGEEERRIDGTASAALVHACLGRWDGEAAIERSDMRIGLSATEPLRTLILYRAPGSAFLCLEPVSHVTDGFNLHAGGRPHTGAVGLAPGESLAGAMAIRCEGV